LTIVVVFTNRGRAGATRRGVALAKNTLIYEKD
jgi:hypothetical protein